MSHQYDHSCHCPECREYELRLQVRAQEDRLSDLVKDVKAYEERKSQKGANHGQGNR